MDEESDETPELYDLERGSRLGFAWQCLVARRLAERGVRFIELIDSGFRVQSYAGRLMRPPARQSPRKLQQ